MPIRRVEYVDQPFAGRRYTPDTSRLSGLYTGMGDMLAASRMQQAQSNQRALLVLGQLFSRYQDTKREQAEATAGAARRQTERAEDKAFTEQQSALARSERATERKDEAAIRAGERKTDAEIRASERAEAAVSKEIDDSPGIVSPALLEAAKKFPNQAARFVLQDGVTVNPMTGAERRAYDRDKSASARAATDDRRLQEQFEESKRHNKALEARTPAGNTPVVVQTPEGPAVLDRKTLTAQPITMAGKTVGVAPSAAERMDSRKFSKAAPVLDGIKELSERINVLNGVIASASGAAEKAKAQINLNDDVAEYQALVSGFTPMIARALGHTGVLTQQDVDSVKELFPTPNDSKSLRDRKILRMRNIIGQLEGVEGVGGVAPAAAEPAGAGPVAMRFNPATGKLEQVRP